MRKTGKRLLHQVSGKSTFCRREIGSKLNSSLQNKNSCKISYSKRCKLKPRSHVKTIGSFLSKRRASEFSANGIRNNSLNGKLMRKTLQKVSDIGNAKKQSSLRLLGGKPSPLSHKGNEKNADGDGRIQGMEKRRKRKKKMEKITLDEASRLKRRTRYLLIKMKLEQNLIDAYSGDGWKGQSREKIKPEKELQRAEKQILECKLGIRDAFCQLDLLSSEGRIEDSVIDPDGRVFHEHIFCAKCKLRDAFPDNDIILCDGTCNCAFHQKCLEPPLATENIPPGDQGWLCKFCECKMEMLEATNAHLGTRFSLNSNWEDIFKEEATTPDGETTSLGPVKEWPSEDSEDDDYDPEINERCSTTGIEENMSDDVSSSSGLFWSSDEASSESRRSIYDGLNGGKINFVDSTMGIDYYDTSDIEITSGRRQRRDVDYKKLHDEMFGKEVNENEQLSEDEDWGPGSRKRRGRESNAGTIVATCNDADGYLNMEVKIEVEKKLPLSSQDKKPLFRIPSNAVEKLRGVFAENELPSRAVKENLSKQLGIASEKVNKWFKNARYMALKIRKAESTKQVHSNSVAKESNKDIGKNCAADQAASKANSCLVFSAASVHIPKSLRVRRRKNSVALTIPVSKQHKRAAGALPTNTIEKLRAALVENQFPSTAVKRKLSKQLGIPYHQVNTWFDSAKYFKTQSSSLKTETTCDKRANLKHENAFRVNGKKDIQQLYLVEMERLFSLEDKVEKMKKVLRLLSDQNNVTSETHLGKQLVTYVPVAELKEKV